MANLTLISKKKYQSGAIARKWQCWNTHTHTHSVKVQNDLFICCIKYIIIYEMNEAHYEMCFDDERTEKKKIERKAGDAAATKSKVASPIKCNMIC